MKIKFTNQGHLSTNVTPDIGLKDEPVLKYDVLVVANTFVDNCKQIATLSFKFLKKRRRFRCTCLLHSSKLVHIDGKNLSGFIQNLVQNLINSVLSSKSNRKWRKVAKTKKVPTTTYMWHSRPWNLYFA